MITVSTAGESVSVNPAIGFIPIYFADFTQNAKTSGLFIPAQAANVAYSMVAKSSTKAATVAALAAGATNQYTLVSLGGNDATQTLPGINLGPFDLIGTDQGHLYNGLRVGYSVGAQLHDINITGVPGSASSPPGETFGISLWHCSGAEANRVKVLGAGVGATLIGLNSSTDAFLTNCVANGSVYGFGLACWQTKDIQVIDFDARANRRALNFERCSGTIFLTRVDMRGQTTTGPHITVNSDQASAKVTITDPQVDAWPLRVGVIVGSALYLGKPQLQKVSDVQLVVGGKDVTADPKYLACGNVW